jgi:CheY-like chemotaxis protein
VPVDGLVAAEKQPMSTHGIKRSEPPPAIHQSAAADLVDPPAMDRTGQPTEDVFLDSEITRILIVDDDPDVLKMVARMASILGYRPTTAEDAEDALSQLNRMRHDLVITDYQMPFIDGYQLADQIKKKRSGTRVIIMTGHCDQGFTDMLESSDVVDGLLLKPFNLQTMKEKIEWAGKFNVGCLTP